MTLRKAILGGAVAVVLGGGAFVLWQGGAGQAVLGALAGCGDVRLWNSEPDQDCLRPPALCPEAGAICETVPRLYTQSGRAPGHVQLALR